MNNDQNQLEKPHLTKTIALCIAALGVVYGDIGTSPLYAINEIMFGHGDIHKYVPNILGAISLVIWSITIVISIKYIIFVLRADSDGEGGVFALYSLLHKLTKKRIGYILPLLILASGLLLGEGTITPAISVLSAVEGMKVVTAAFNPFIVPITILILTGIFFIQKGGTHKIGKVFGPVIMIWFTSIGLLGLSQVIKTPAILQAFNPLMGVRFIMTHHWKTVLFTLGSVMLVITGGEALYADMGHFGKTPIRLSWFFLAYPALILNYLGQGAYLLSRAPVAHENIFYSMVPSVLLLPMVLLATAATVIASQALISGAFSIMAQAITLGLMPYLKVKHTHHEHMGQIYMPFINWMLYAGAVTLVIMFQTSTRLASAYGLSVSGVMFMTSISMMGVSRYIWKWAAFKSILVFGPLILIDLIFLTANSLKFFQGGYIPLSIGILMLIVMLVWQWGRKRVHKKYSTYPTMTIRELIKLKESLPKTTRNSAVIMTPDLLQSQDQKIPLLGQLIWDRYETLPKHIVFLTVTIEDTPHMHQERFHFYGLYEHHEKGSIISVQVNFGFMEEPNVEKVLDNLAEKKILQLPVDHKEWVIDALHERIYLTGKSTRFERAKFRLFRFLSRNASTADQYFRLGKETQLSIEVLPVHF